MSDEVEFNFQTLESAINSIHGLELVAVRWESKDRPEEHKDTDARSVIRRAVEESGRFND